MQTRANTTAVAVRDGYVREHGTTAIEAPRNGAGLKDYQTFVAETFAAAPDVDARILPSYDAMMDECIAQFRWLLRFSGYTVSFHDDDPTPTKPNGAPDYAAFVAEVEATRELKVYRSQGEHPILDASVIWHNGRAETLNTVFRAVHDFFGHLASGGHFGWNGETAAYVSHAGMFSQQARIALFSETVAQQCWYAVHRDFAPQKCVHYGAEWHNPPFKGR